MSVLGRTVRLVDGDRVWLRGADGKVREVQTERGRGDNSKLVTSEPAFQTLLDDLHASLAAQSAKIDRDDLFKIPNIMVLAGDAFLFVKPLRRRFWLPRAALTDADQIVKTVHAQAWERSHS